MSKDIPAVSTEILARSMKELRKEIEDLNSDIETANRTFNESAKQHAVENDLYKIEELKNKEAAIWDFAKSINVHEALDHLVNKASEPVRKPVRAKP